VWYIHYIIFDAINNLRTLWLYPRGTYIYILILRNALRVGRRYRFFFFKKPDFHYISKETGKPAFWSYYIIWLIYYPVQLWFWNLTSSYSTYCTRFTYYSIRQMIQRLRMISELNMRLKSTKMHVYTADGNFEFLKNILAIWIRIINSNLEISWYLF